MFSFPELPDAYEARQALGLSGANVVGVTYPGDRAHFVLLVPEPASQLHGKNLQTKITATSRSTNGPKTVKAHINAGGS